MCYSINSKISWWYHIYVSSLNLDHDFLMLFGLMACLRNDLYSVFTIKWVGCVAFEEQQRIHLLPQFKSVALTDCETQGSPAL